MYFVQDLNPSNHEIVLCKPLPVYTYTEVRLLCRALLESPGILHAPIDLEPLPPDPYSPAWDSEQHVPEERRENKLKLRPSPAVRSVATVCVSTSAEKNAPRATLLSYMSRQSNFQRSACVQAVSGLSRLLTRFSIDIFSGPLSLNTAIASRIECMAP